MLIETAKHKLSFLRLTLNVKCVYVCMFHLKWIESCKRGEIKAEMIISWFDCNGEGYSFIWKKMLCTVMVIRVVFWIFLS